MIAAKKKRARTPAAIMLRAMARGQAREPTYQGEHRARRVVKAARGYETMSEALEARGAPPWFLFQFCYLTLTGRNRERFLSCRDRRLCGCSTRTATAPFDERAAKAHAYDKRIATWIVARLVGRKARR